MADSPWRSSMQVRMSVGLHAKCYLNYYELRAPVSRSGKRRKIIAVFGGNTVDNDVLDSAKCFARVLADQGVIVMTGAVPPVKESQVKGAVLQQVQASKNPWVGIHNCSHAERREPAADEHGLGLAVHPLIGEQRNFLESMLCDAAVVLPGGAGAISEAVSVLSLRKPVLLGGTSQHWERQRCRALYDLFLTRRTDAPSATQLIRRSMGPLGSSGPLWDRIAATLIPQNLLSLPESCSLASRSPQFIAAWVGRVPREGNYPDLAGHDIVRKKYHNWLAASALLR